MIETVAERAKTGIAGLDDVLLGGLPASHLFLVEGEPGTGKTTLGLQFLLEGARRGERVLYITLSESEREIKEVAKGHDWNLDGISIFESSERDELLLPEDQYSVFHPSEVELQDTTQTILKKIEEINPRRVVLDSLSEIRLLAKDGLRYRRQVLALKHYFSTRHCTVMLLDDQTSQVEDLQLRSIAHGVLVLEMRPREYGVTRRRMRVSKMRGSTFREGHHDYTIERGGVVVFPRLVSAEHRQPLQQHVISSGIPGLDALWGGGLFLGSSTLIVGPAGAGKSSVASAYALAAAERGEGSHVILFDEGVPLALERSKRIGMDMDAHYRRGLIRMEQVDPAELSPGEFVERIRRGVESGETKILILDSLNGLLAAMPGEDHLVLQLHEMLSYLSQKGVTTILILAQNGILGSGMVSPLDISYLADNMLLLRYFEAVGEVRKAISVVKKRRGGHERTIREINFSDAGVEVGEPLDKFQGVLTGIPTFTGAVNTLQREMGGSRKS